jgi:alcohol-forming fatty acyl-CoA reductase
MLKKRHGNVPMTIVRPSIIISCQDEPVLGWTETLSAAGGLTFSATIGLLHYLKANGKLLIDIIPCDFVSNTILTATVHTGRGPRDSFNVCHSASSALKPLSI